MDIRNFFKKPRLENIQEQEAEGPAAEAEGPSTSAIVAEYSEPAEEASTSTPALVSNFDIGKYINNNISAEAKLSVFNNTWVPCKNYNFKKVGESRSFRYEWLESFAPWLAYSEFGDGGALCKFCVLFKPKVHRGLQGSFIVKGFKNYKKFTEAARNHVQSDWHKSALLEGSSLMAIRDESAQSIATCLSKSRQDLIESNRLKLGSIVRTIVFCGTHDLPLRGKESTDGNFRDLLEFRVQSGDLVLKNHLEKAARNAMYTSVRTEHEIISICEEIIASGIVEKANRSRSFSILADETSDIAGVEQLTLGVRFALFEDGKLTLAEEFLGFVELKKFDAQSISEAILSKCASLNLNMEYCIGQGYDGCSVMSGKEGGVKTIIQRKYPNAHFVHCSSHRLNLVVNDLNNVSDVRNTIGTIKEIINFFRESNIRRQMLTSIPMFCETRWVEKYKSIRLFKKNFEIILKTLLEIAQGISNGKQKANCLYSAAIRPSFLITLFIIAKYSEFLEPVTSLLQGVNINLLECQNHIKRLISIFNEEREKFDDIFLECENFSEAIDVELQIPRLAGKQTKRANYPTSDPKQYYKQSIFLPYIDSLISSLNIRFSEENTAIFNYFRLYPSSFKTIAQEKVNHLSLEIDKSGDLLTEAIVWHKIVEESNISTLEDMLEAAKFVPRIQAVLLKSLALPVTTASMERSFSTLRRVKTWLRSTMSEARVSGLCMLSVHRQKIKKDEENFVAQVINKFGQNERRLVLLFDKN